MNKKLHHVVAIVCIAFSTKSKAVTWTGGGDELFALWSDIDNWDTGEAPTSSDAVLFDGDFFLNRTAVDDDFAIASLTFQNQTSPGEIRVFGVGSLTINGGITNNTSQLQTIRTTFNTGSANPTWDGPLAFTNSVNMGTRRATIVDSVAFSAGPITFDINTLSAYGRFLGSGSTTFSSVTINVAGSFAAWADGQTFDFTTTNFTGATLGTLPTLTEGLVWNTSQFLSQGVLSVESAIPEPSTIAALLGLGALGMAGTRRRRRAVAA